MMRARDWAECMQVFMRGDVLEGKPLALERLKGAFFNSCRLQFIA